MDADAARLGLIHGDVSPAHVYANGVLRSAEVRAMWPGDVCRACYVACPDPTAVE